MSPQEVVGEAKKELDAAVAHFSEELKKLRTGRAHPGMLDSVMVEAYGSLMPLNQTATITTVDVQLLQVMPFDPGTLQAIATAIRNNQSLGLNPTDDGRVVRVPIPALTEERRRELTKVIGQKQEECMVALRNARHDALNTLDRLKKDKTISEDEAKRQERQVEDLMAKAREQTEISAKTKEKEIMSI